MSLLQLAEQSLPRIQHHGCLDVVDACVTLASFLYVITNVTVRLASVSKSGRKLIC